MCHEYRSRAWDREPTETESEGEEETPEFLGDETVDDAEILTDGGDEA